MTQMLVSTENPSGEKLEDLLRVVRADVIRRLAGYANDPRQQARDLVAANVKVLEHLSEAIRLAEGSTQMLEKAFGRSDLPAELEQ